MQAVTTTIIATSAVVRSLSLISLIPQERQCFRSCVNVVLFLPQITRTSCNCPTLAARFGEKCYFHRPSDTACDRLGRGVLNGVFRAGQSKNLFDRTGQLRHGLWEKRFAATVGCEL